VPCKGRTPGRKQSNGRGPSWTGVCPCCHRQEMPALKDRRLTGKVLHGAHFPMKSFVSAGKASLLLRDLLRYKCRIRSFALTMKTQSNSGFSLPRLVLMLFLFCTGLIIAVLASVGTPLSAEGPTETQQPSGPKSGHSYKNDVSPPLRDLPHWREGEGKTGTRS
jgi:hypothetical protein